MSVKENAPSPHTHTHTRSILFIYIYKMARVGTFMKSGLALPDDIEPNNTTNDHIAGQVFLQHTRIVHTRIQKKRLLLTDGSRRNTLQQSEPKRAVASAFTHFGG